MTKFNWIKTQNFPDCPTEEIDGRRHYVLPNGNKLPSVTTVINYPESPYLEKWRNDVGQAEAKRITNISSSRGTKMHTICEKYLANDENYLKGVMPDAKALFQKIKPYLDFGVKEIHYSEICLYSETLGLAGKSDLICQFYNGKKTSLSIVDFKNSRKKKQKRNITNYAMQGTAYALMYKEMFGLPIEDVYVLIGVEEPSVGQIFHFNVQDHVNGLYKKIKEYQDAFSG